MAIRLTDNMQDRPSSSDKSAALTRNESHEHPAIPARAVMNSPATVVIADKCGAPCCTISANSPFPTRCCSKRDPWRLRKKRRRSRRSRGLRLAV